MENKTWPDYLAWTVIVVLILVLIWYIYNLPEQYDYIEFGQSLFWSRYIDRRYFGHHYFWSYRLQKVKSDQFVTALVSYHTAQLLAKHPQ